MGNARGSSYPPFATVVERQGSMSLPWFRMHAEFSGDPVIQSLAFEDQRHYIILLCLKCNGTLDRDVSDDLRDRIVLRGLGLDPVTGSEAKRRLMEVGLIANDWQPCGWDKRQFKSDTSTERVRTFRKRSETVTETDQIQIQNRTDKPKDIVGLKPSIPPLALRTAFKVTAIEVLKFLNEKTGRSYEAVPANLDLIVARLKDGATPDDLRAVVAKKCREWRGDEKMDTYLRPKTLFSRTNYAQYRGEIGNAQAVS